jgi:hypothetical protein
MKKNLTAAEAIAKLNADPAYVAGRREQDEKFARIREQYAQAEAPLVKELRAAKVSVNSVWDLVNSRDVYPRSLPILLNHLQRPYPEAIRDGIARALAIPDAKFAWHVLVNLYRREPENRAKDGLAVALSNIADDEVMTELISLARDARYGGSRILLLDALRRSRLPQARRALMKCGKDPVLQKEVQRILSRMKPIKHDRHR